MLPKISVFLIVYQQVEFIRDTIESIIVQDYPNLEIVIGDDGSTDGTQEVLSEYGEKYPGLFKLIFSPENEGITANSNKVLAQCSGDYIALLGGDDLWLPGKLHKQMEWFLKNPEASICYTKTEKFESSTGKRISFIPRRASRRNTPTGLGEFLKAPPLYICSSFMIPHWAAPESGFDERVKLVSDWLFLLDVLTKGHMGYIDEVLTRYRRHEDNTSEKINEMVPDIMLACDIAEKKYPDYVEYLKKFRMDWILVYIHSNQLWRVFLPRAIIKSSILVSRTIVRKLRDVLDEYLFKARV